MSLLDDFILRAALAGLGAALATGPLGCFVVWRRMAYFGDATAHAALLGVALALGLGLPVLGGVLALSVLMAVLVWALSGRHVATDTLLGVLSHAALAIGIVGIALTRNAPVDLEAYLLGDILAVSRADLAVIWGGGLAIAGLVAWRWSALLTATVGEDLASAEGIDPERERLWLMLALAVCVAVAIKVLGVLLIAALLIIPPAMARLMARTPEQMAVLAVLIGMGATLGGLGGAFVFDTPAGPTMVLTAALGYGAAVILRLLRQRV